MTLHPQFWWWVTRATGMVAWAAATASVAWGITVSGRLVRRRKLPAWLLDLHRHLATLTVAFLALHLGALVAVYAVRLKECLLLVQLEGCPDALGQRFCLQEGVLRVVELHVAGLRRAVDALDVGDVLLLA